MKGFIARRDPRPGGARIAASFKHTAMNQALLMLLLSLGGGQETASPNAPFAAPIVGVDRRDTPVDRDRFHVVLPDGRRIVLRPGDDGVLVGDASDAALPLAREPR